MSRILVIGGSLGGLLAANVLHHLGHDVCVLEKVRGSMDGRGAGIVTHDALFAGLQRAGLNIEGRRQRVALSAEGGTEVCIDMPQVLTSWSRLYDLLHQLLPAERYVQGVTVQRIEQLIGYPVARRPACCAQRDGGGRRNRHRHGPLWAPECFSRHET
jgi:2-polyprenyl-6-methoxyphenol hydroxylase-like FAD-dependent oxidoreductase